MSLTRETCAGHGAASDRRAFAPPGTPAQYPPDRLADIRHIRLDLEVVPEKRSLKGVATHFLTPLGRPLSRMVFDLCELTVDAVRVDGKVAPFHHEGGRLEVTLKPAAPLGREVRVEIAYHGSPRTGLNFTGPDRDYPDRPHQAWSQGQDEYARFWFPCHDFPNQKSTTEVVCGAPEKYQVVSNGRLVSSVKKGRRRVWHWLQEVPHVAYLVTLVVGEFEHWSDDVGGLPVEYYVPPGRRADGERAFSRTPEMIQVFADFTGQPYPYARYAQVVVRDFTWGGMENTTATTLIDYVVHDERAALDYGTTAARLVSHELAHQWFGDYLTCREWAHAWLNEGFASYFETLWLEHAGGYEAAQQARLEDAAAYFAEDGEYRRPIVSRSYVEPHSLFDRHLYEKGAWVLWMLRQTVGDDLFRRGVQEYVARHRAGLVKTEDLQRAFEDVTGRSLGWFFDQWVYGTGHPELEVSYRWDDARKVGDLRVKQTQKVDQTADQAPRGPREGGTHVFRAPLVVAFGQAGGAPALREVEIGVDGQAESGFSFALPKRPTWVRFDRQNRLLKTLKFERAEELLRAQLAEDEFTGRVEAARQLGENGSPAAIAALTAALRRDPAWGVRAEAARALGATRTEAAKQALIAALGGGAATTEARVRTAAATALAAFRGDGEVAAALTAALDDASYYAAAAAARSLGRIRAASSLDGLRRALTLDSHRDVIRATALDGLASLRDATVLPEILELARPGWFSRLRAAALLQAANLARNLPPEQRTPAREAAEAALFDPLYFVRRGAIQALVVLGDAAAVGPLRALLARDVEGAVRGECRVAIETLLRGTGREAEIRNLRDEVERLSQAETALRERVAKLEPAAGGRAKGGAKRAGAAKRPAKPARARR
ncbi:MAG TPA: M1 family aminopeptidase [Candidatus Dormibacteraeota bacterium]|nr:M1 family aminopeptidase [Candidatus Dormibacteraeota bacterium]